MCLDRDERPGDDTRLAKARKCCRGFYLEHPLGRLGNLAVAQQLARLDQAKPKAHRGAAVLGHRGNVLAQDLHVIMGLDRVAELDK
jgi:hypothetical protein